ncbi:hypothetical protein F5882DRAFT_385812 [Hyaloscypha sp. PMI_1271]|nr:hypothetical protein F5882DRAFT_385812 [Hyaloscypha sp. PMI_1271]
MRRCSTPNLWFTPGSAPEPLITVSDQNIIRVLGGVTGALVKSRALAPPCQAVDSSHGDIPDTIEIAKTPIIVSAPMVNFGVNPTSNALPQQNHFEPSKYDSLNGGDRGFGSLGVGLLDSSVYKATGVSCITITSGKSGVIYVMNADNLGRFKNGPGSMDAVIQGIS